MALTMPQLIMISHASSVNYKRMEAKRKKGSPEEQDPNDPVVTVGSVTKRFSKLTPDELDTYYSQM